ncbi:PLP-dependent aminotransferase family protein [Cohnella silvisoli]|uniref:PLP-dependent aminotransferase family protein n=1 Tax=Cohnella silvisoli TaxID=2873699 RepID=A0ABV1L244_9BACL|nr:PLP-dependent aminotransferase family protein [Cohnella silvisoli]MCD9026450.1 PLP-dependent aminotransferase family protein [Cohnella silvisoli]
MIFPVAYSAKLAESGSKHLALYQAIREAIMEGKLSPQEKLPSTRQLAALFGLSRGSVSLAYEMLAAEGFVQAGVGQGTFVAGWEDEEHTANKIHSGDEQANVSLAAPALTAWGRRLMELQAAVTPLSAVNIIARNQQSSRPEPISFVPNGVGMKWFPWMEWKAEVGAQWKRFGESWEIESDSTEGSLQLRQAIANRLRRERGITCDAEDIVITAGSMQAITLLTQLLLEEGKTAVIENPCYTGIKRAIQATGASFIAQGVDGQGIVPQDWDAQLLFVTPTRQFPTGAVLSYERRRALLSWASRRNGWIVEDDFDSDFRWGGRPIEPLKALDREGRVVYVGTFSRSMCTGVRIGYAVAPKELVQPLILAKKLYDPFPSGIAEQQALASWMSEGGYDRHMRRMRRVYGKLEGKLRTGLERDLAGLFEVNASDAGLHLYAKWKKSNDEYRQLVEECGRRGVLWKDGEGYTVYERHDSNPHVPSALFSFAHLDEGEIDVGLNLIREAAESISLIDSSRGQGGTVHA